MAGCEKRGRKEHSTVNRLIGDLCNYKNGLVMGVAILGVKSGIQVFTIWWLKEQRTPACNAGDSGLIPGSGRSPGEGHGNLLQYSRLGSPMDRRAWQATVHGVPNGRLSLHKNPMSTRYLVGGVKGLLCITLDFREDS